MCVSLGPAQFSNTILYVGPAVRDGKKVHVLGYQNEAKNLAVAVPTRPSGLDPKLWSQVLKQKEPAPAGNAMILPFPAASVMGKENVIDTKGCTNILKDIVEALKPRTRSMSKGFIDGLMSFSSPVEVFEHGIYTVVLARDPRDIPAALEQVPIEKRPDLKPEIFAAYAEWYPGWQITLCCFNNAEAVEADPLLWWYEPAFPDVYFAPALDSHSGDVPDLGAQVELDHAITVGTAEEGGAFVDYADDLPESVRAVLPQFALGREYKGEDMPNGDFLFLKKDVDAGSFDPHRIAPGENPRITLR